MVNGKNSPKHTCEYETHESQRGQNGKKESQTESYRANKIAEKAHTHRNSSTVWYNIFAVVYMVTETRLKSNKNGNSMCRTEDVEKRQTSSNTIKYKNIESEG